MKTTKPPTIQRLQEIRAVLEQLEEELYDHHRAAADDIGYAAGDLDDVISEWDERISP